MEQRLIDANALKEEVNKKQVVGRFNVLNLIDSAPTVEYPFYAEAYQTGCEEGKNDRPKGHWIRRPQGHYVCSLCEKGMYKSDFCPSCGAKMKGGNE